MKSISAPYLEVLSSAIVEVTLFLAVRWQKMHVFNFDPTQIIVRLKEQVQNLI